MVIIVVHRAIFSRTFVASRKQLFLYFAFALLSSELSFLVADRKLIYQRVLDKVINLMRDNICSQLNVPYNISVLSTVIYRNV